MSAGAAPPAPRKPKSAKLTEPESPRKQEGPLSLYGQTPEEALRRAMSVPPPRKGK